jgi:nitroimidazol reductase NimA-like FMN-containing flavoprotein (pyridoxamine 5'-phosphate oxidase superfamily)
MGKKWLNEDECCRFLDGESVGRLATSLNGEPYVVPVNFVRISRNIYIHSGFKGRKIDNIKLNPSVCFEASREIKMIPAEKACKFSVEFISVLAFGKAEIISDAELKHEIMKALTKKYAHSDIEPELLIEDVNKACVIEITIDRISGRMSAAV